MAPTAQLPAGPTLRPGSAPRSAPTNPPATPQPASADGTRTLVATTTCRSGIVPFGFQLNWGSGWTSDFPGSSYQIPGTQTKVLTATIPGAATSIALDTFCYANRDEYYGRVSYPYGTWIGYTSGLTPGASRVSSTWSCDRYPVYPGPWVRTCSLAAISYG